MGEEPNEQKLFTLSEAERIRRELEPVLIEAMNGRRRLGELEENLSRLANRIMVMGGVIVSYDKAAKLRADHDRMVAVVKSALERIEATGCLVKDLDVGLLDFPAIVEDEEVYLCWRLGEDRIRFYHRQDEGFAGRKPLDPRDTGPSNPIQ